MVFFSVLLDGAHVTIRDFPGHARETENFSSCSLYLRKKGKFISSVVQTYAWTEFVQHSLTVYNIFFLVSSTPFCSHKRCTFCAVVLTEWLNSLIGILCLMFGFIFFCKMKFYCFFMFPIGYKTFKLLQTNINLQMKINTKTSGWLHLHWFPIVTCTNYCTISFIYCYALMLPFKY